MFVKKVKNKNGKVYLYLVESFRDEHGKPKHRRIASLGPEEEFLKAIAKAYLPETISAKQYMWAIPAIVNWLWKRLGIEDVIKQIERKHKITFPLNEIVKALVAARLANPSSKLRTWSDYFEQIAPGTIKVKRVGLQHVYRTLKYLHMHKEEIEKALWNRNKNLFNSQDDVILYDLTTLYYESVKEDELRRFGMSKDGRGDVVQIVLGLSSTDRGLPVGFEVFKGNQWEGHTIERIIANLKGKIDVNNSRIIMVADKGLFSKANLDLLERECVGYVLGFRLKHVATKLGVEKDQLYDLSGMEQLSEGLYYREYRWEGRRVIVVYSKQRAGYEIEMIDKQVKWLRSRVKSGGSGVKGLLKGKQWSRYLKVSGDEVQIDEASIKEAKLTCGFTALVTSEETLSAGEVIGRYSRLWRIEDAFRQIKTTLEARPMYVWTEESIVGHLITCYLAYYIERYIGIKIESAGIKLGGKEVEQAWIEPRMLSSVRALEKLGEVGLVKFKLFGRDVKVYTNIDKVVRKIFRAIGYKLPVGIDIVNSNSK